MEMEFWLPTQSFCTIIIRNLAVQKVDLSIRSALNCGVKSYVPIAFYTLEKLDKQLNDAMHSFLISETAIDMNNKTVATSKLLHDFGRTSG